MIISMPEVWDKAVGRHRAYVMKVIHEALLDPALTSDHLKKLVRGNARTLAVGKPDDLEALIGTVKTWQSDPRTTNADRSAFHEQAEQIFDYGVFSNKKTKGWNAFELCKLSNHRLCPYCQQAFAFTITARRAPKPGGKVAPGAKRGFRPTLDHFFPKSEHPYLALSLYNLVPACQVCNSSLKSKTDFYDHKHLHPLRDAECLKFELRAKDYLRYRQRPNAGLKLRAFVADSSKQSLGDASIETFLLNKRYSSHNLELARWMESLRHWTPSEIRRLADRFDVKGADAMARFEAMLFNFDRNDHRYEMLGRIKLDLYEAVQAVHSTAALSPGP